MLLHNPSNKHTSSLTCLEELHIELTYIFLSLVVVAISDWRGVCGHNTKDSLTQLNFSAEGAPKAELWNKITSD